MGKRSNNASQANKDKAGIKPHQSRRSTKKNEEAAGMKPPPHEANSYFLVTNQRITSQTKYFLVKWHWFWDKYNEGKFRIEKCPTDLQRADYMTKPLARDKFEANRKYVQGW